jgi:pre-rRNA-processing protein TSR3
MLRFCSVVIDFTSYMCITMADKSHQSTEEGSDDDSDDGLPPLEENMNRLNLSEDEEESEEESETE